jgi:hypothetical protein
MLHGRDNFKDEKKAKPNEKNSKVRTQEGNPLENKAFPQRSL